jgi:predicted nucleic acid-binding Zn ribbon protein
MAQQNLTPNLKKRTQKQADLKSEISVLLKNIKAEKRKRYAFWEDVVGEKIAKVAEPVKNKNGILFVKVQDATWRFELTRRKPEICTLINEHLKKNTIKDIVFI